MVQEKNSVHPSKDRDFLLGMIESQGSVIQEIVDCLPKYHMAMKDVSDRLELIDFEFQTMFDYNPIHHIECRVKSPESIVHKMQRKNIPVGLENFKREILDTAGIRVICNYLNDIFELSELLILRKDTELIRVNDYITAPKENGYRSLHLIVRVPVTHGGITEKLPVEIQIRTIAMDMWASLEHEMQYKKSKGMDCSTKDRERLAKCAETLAQLDEEMQDIYHSCSREHA